MHFGTKTNYATQDFFSPVYKKLDNNPNLGPGTTEYQKPFGSQVKHKMHIFGRKKERPNMVPPPGYYNPNPQKLSIYKKPPTPIIRKV